MISQKAEFPIGLAKSKTSQEQPVDAGGAKPISAGLSSLTPRSLSGVFDESFELYKRNFGVLALIVALVYIPTQILVYAVSNLVLRPTAAQSASSDADFTSAFMTVILSFMIGSPQEGLPGYLPLLLS